MKGTPSPTIGPALAPLERIMQKQKQKQQQQKQKQKEEHQERPSADDVHWPPSSRSRSQSQSQSRSCNCSCCLRCRCRCRCRCAANLRLLLLLVSLLAAAPRASGAAFAVHPRVCGGGSEAAASLLPGGRNPLAPTVAVVVAVAVAGRTSATAAERKARTATRSEGGRWRSLSPLSLSVSSNKDLLYEVQEQMLIRQGEREERIMRGNLEDLEEPLEAPSLDQRGRERERRRLREMYAPYSEALRKEGVVRINSVLDREMAARLRGWVMKYREESLRLVQEGSVRVQDRFADVLLKKNRSDMTLPLLLLADKVHHEEADPEADADSVVSGALAQVLLESPIGILLESAFAPAFSAEGNRKSTEASDPILYELSTLISDPGSQRQVVHPDNPMVAASASPTSSSPSPSPSVPVLLTCFVALQDVTEDMGPTLYLPGTHNAESHAQFFDTTTTARSTFAPSPVASTATIDAADDAIPASPKEMLLSQRTKVRALLRAGDCALYDSRVLHCGTANRRKKKKKNMNLDKGVEDDGDDEQDASCSSSRALFYFSFRNPLIDDPGNPPSIRAGLGRARLRLSELRRALAAKAAAGTPRRQGSETPKAAGFGGKGPSKSKRNSGGGGGFGGGGASRR